ncbi:hypothetical protein [Glaciibacter psychrotolerans]|uniref:Uncharacterized protein n=1 Tax=Glaciibacter psychrotolerans TaxID=670054 RepID=A0A7Z0J4J1_9MICO|nr:hypothetical protein [Leifsonia psychrotolerans]NYJ18442.1 hypothetical protein [Leifsonia psychrotolerans]
MAAGAELAEHLLERGLIVAATDRASLDTAADHLDRIDGILNQADTDDEAVLAAVAPELAAALDAIAQVSPAARSGVIDESDLLELGRLRDRIGGADAGATASDTAAPRALRTVLTTALIELEADVHDLLADLADLDDASDHD